MKGDKIMARILENNVVLTISKIVKSTDTNESISLPADFTDNVVDLISQLLGDGFIVEVTAAE